MSFAGGETITVTPQTPGPPDQLGGPTGTPGTPYDITGCGIAPSDTADIDLAPVGVVVDLTVYAPPGTDIPTSAVVTARGDDHKIVGTLRSWRSPFSGRTHGVVFALQATPAKT